MAGGTYSVSTPEGGPLAGVSWLRHRHLLLHLVASDVRSRYRRSYLGILWALIWPVGFSLILSSVAIHVFRQPVEVYMLYVLSGMVVWDLIAGSITGGVASIQQAEGYLKQTRLPYLLFPLRTVSFLSVNTFFSSLACVLMILLLNPSAVSWTWLLWPVTWLMTYLFAVPLCLISAIANLKFRDYQHGISLVMFLFWYLSPNMIVREVFENPGLKTFTDLNPFTSLLDMFRNVSLYGKLPDTHDLTIWAAYTVGAWIVALLWLRNEHGRLIYYM